MKQQIYNNPILHADYSDPDVIRVGDDFFMVASSFNHTPGVPILHSKNLVDWKLVNYVFDKVPFERFRDVQHGHGAWAPSIRYQNGLFYCIIPFPDEGIYISSTTDPFGAWSDLWCLIPGNGIIDPCPIWTEDGRCYLAVGFAKSRIGFNSCIGLYEVSPDLKNQLTDYKIIYDGHNDNPTIEGPKFNVRNGYYYIMAPAGSVKTGWQVCLRSKEIYGPYETKIVLFQGDTPTNGPHQGALIDLDNHDNWAFIHFQDKKCYGRIVHLQPVTWHNDWPICGSCKDPLISGTPVLAHEYLVDVESDFSVPTSDNFQGTDLSLIWQTPANKSEGWYRMNEGLELACYYHDEVANNALNMTPNLFLQKLALPSFTVQTNATLHLNQIGDEVGLCIMGRTYGYICVRKEDVGLCIYLASGEFDQPMDRYEKVGVLSDSSVQFNLEYTDPDKFRLGFNGTIIEKEFIATPGRWIGSKVGIYAKGLKNSTGYATFTSFEMVEK